MKSKLDLRADEFRVLAYLKTVRRPKNLEEIGYAIKAYKDKKAIQFAEENIANLVGQNLVTESIDDDTIKYEAILTETEEVKSVLDWEKTRPTNDPLERATKVTFKPHSLSPAMKRDGIEEQEGYVIDWHFNEEYKRYVNIAPIDDDGNIIRKKIAKRDRALTIIELPTDEMVEALDGVLKRPKRIFKKIKTEEDASNIISFDEMEMHNLNLEEEFQTDELDLDF